ncbi:MAG: Na+/H+ antiporter subunit E [Pseudomonadota bacterium]
MSGNATSAVGSPTVRALGLFTALAAAWLLWSGLYKPLLLVLGALSCTLVVYLSRRMGFLRGELFALGFSLRLLAYWLWLLGEMVKSSLQVTRQVLKPTVRISPQVVTLDVSDKSPVEQVILANSITLTPGTVALDVHEGRLAVHALTQAGARELEAGVMARRVAALRRPR